MNGTTSAFAAQFLALLNPSGAPPAVSTLYQPLCFVYDAGDQSRMRQSGSTTSVLQNQSLPASASEASEPAVVAHQASRNTTPAEHAVGEFRRWSALGSDWDGEGAAAPIQNS